MKRIEVLNIVAASLQNPIIPLGKWKEVLKRESRSTSLKQDIADLARNEMSDITNSSYLLGQPQAYLMESLTQANRSNILRLRLHTLPIEEFNPKWAKLHTSEDKSCRLCNYARETWAHLLCCCPSMINDRKILLKQIF